MAIVTGAQALAADVVDLINIAETEVFNGNSPNAWTDLDLSGTIGAKVALVLLKVNNAANLHTVAVRKNGDADEFWNVGAMVFAYGCAAGYHVAGIHLVLLVATDAAGIIEWKAENVVAATTIDIIAYIKRG